MRALAALVALALLSCDHPPSVARSVRALEAPGCTSPRDFGAVPDDGADDREAIQRAIDSGADCVRIDGTYHVTRRPQLGSLGIGSLQIRRPLRLEGDGVISMLGSGAHRDWYLIQVAAADVTISGITLSGRERTETEEQTHLIHASPGTSRLTIEDVAFDFPPIGPSSGGDCIRLLGNLGAPVTDTTVRDIVGAVCDRSLIGVQRGVFGLLVDHVESAIVGDQVLDIEPSGGPAYACAPIVRDVVISDSILRRGVGGGLAVAIQGDGCALTTGVRISDSVIDGGILATDVGTLTIERTLVRAVGTLPLHVFKRALDVRVIDSRLERFGPGAVFHAHDQNGFAPTRVIVIGGSSGIVHMENVDSFISIGVQLDIRWRGVGEPKSIP